MPAFNLIAPMRMPQAYRPARTHADFDWMRDAAVPAWRRVRRLGAASNERVSRIWFFLLHAFFSICDLLAALRNRLPSAQDMAPSTRIAYAAVGVMAAILVNDLVGRTPAVSAVTLEPERRPEWFESTRPYGAFALESPAVESLDTRYQVRRHRIGGGRKDELTFGAPDKRGPYARVSLYRPGNEGMADPDALEAIVALAAQSGIDAELQETNGKLRTKFGSLPVIAMKVAGANDVRTCVAAAGSWNDPSFGLVAWWCNDGPEIVAHGEFACLLDRISLMSAGGDDHLAEFFARAELKRNFCNAHGSFVSATPKLVNDWMHAKRGPQLRGRIAGR